MRFLFKYPTRGRPDWFRETLITYYQNLSGNHEYQFVIAMDNDDKAMNNQSMISWLNNQKHLSYFYADHTNKIQACNTGIPDEGWDILILVSDDMIPIIDGFDDIITQDMKREFPGLDGALQYNDGFRSDILMTFSIIGREFYKRYGWVYYPSYHSTWCDNEVTDVAIEWKKFWHSDLNIVLHDWKKHGTYTDYVYTKSDADMDRDEAVYRQRKKKWFPLSFSQNDEDGVIRRHFKDQFKGRFLDIGAADGVTFSNTKILYDMGWTGLAVEPSPNLCKAMAENCPGTKIFQAALTYKNGLVDMYHTPGLVSTLNEKCKKEWENTVKYKKIKVDGIDWQALLGCYGSDFDFINIDIEGENIPMLRLMPAEYKKRARLICVEYDYKIDVVKNELEPYGFKLLHTTGENVILAK